MERAMLGITVHDRVRNELIRRCTKVGLHTCVRPKPNVAEEKTNVGASAFRSGDCGEWRSVGRPPARWSDDIKKTAGTVWKRETKSRAERKKIGEAYAQGWANTR
ncbi:unnamed protein product, partial [Iphiclides podalirius]